MSGGVEWLFQGQHIRASLMRGEREDVVVTFNHWRVGRAGFDDIHDDSWITQRGHGHLRIQTAANDWYLNADLRPAHQALREAAPRIGKTRLFGLSMGGFGALMFGAALGSEAGLLISPSLPRKFHDAASLQAAAQGPRYTFLYDPKIPVDVWSVGVISDLLPGSQLVSLAGGGHPATGVLHRAGRFNIVRRAATGETSDPSMIAKAHHRLHA
ncbi:MAG: hypothetical protein ABI459_00795 [Deltaproteobacteria bacterium]